MRVRCPPQDAPAPGSAIWRTVGIGSVDASTLMEDGDKGHHGGLGPPETLLNGPVTTEIALKQIPEDRSKVDYDKEKNREQRKMTGLGACFPLAYLSSCRTSHFFCLCLWSQGLQSPSHQLLHRVELGSGSPDSPPPALDDPLSPRWCQPLFGGSPAPSLPPPAAAASYS